MAVENIQIAGVGSYNSTFTGLCLKSSSTTPAVPYIRWTTWENTAGRQYKISTRWRGIPKGGTASEQDWYGEWSDWGVKEITSASFGPGVWQESGSDLWHWQVLLDPLLESTGNNPNGGSWTYSSREYDQIEVAVVIEAIEPDGLTYSGSSSVWVGSFPDCVVTDVYVQGEWLVIRYNAPGWTRKDDRWEMLELTTGGKEVLSPNIWGSQAGKVEQLGWITIPKSSMQRTLSPGDDVHIHVRWNAVYRIAGMEWDDDERYVEVSDHGAANLPTGDVTINPDGSISVDLGDSGSGGDTIDSWQTVISGGGFEFDEVQASGVSPNALLKYPPLDTLVRIEIQGSTVTGGTGGSIVKEVKVPSDGRILVDPIDSTGERTSEQVVGRYNVDWDASGDREKTVVKFAGRKRPSVAFGTGGEKSVNASWVEPLEDGLPSVEAAQALSEAGLCVMRFPGGERYLVALDSVQTSLSYDKASLSVSVSGQEVV